MKIFETVLLVAFVCCINVNSRESFETEESELKLRRKFKRIVGGYRSQTYEIAKHIASLRYGNDGGVFGRNHFCAGSIITLNLILTAAHCVTRLPSDVLRDKDQMVVIVGLINRLEDSEWEQVFNVKDVMRHPEFDQRTAYADIAMLRLDHNIREDAVHVQRIVLNKEIPKIGEQCLGVGWGQIILNGPLSDELVYVNVTVFSPDQCGLSIQITDGTICAGDPHGHQKIAGKGDSGGPLICNGKLFGVGSFVTRLQTYYSAVNMFYDWILKGHTKRFEPNNVLLKFSMVRLLSHFIRK